LEFSEQVFNFFLIVFVDDDWGGVRLFLIFCLDLDVSGHEGDGGDLAGQFYCLGSVLLERDVEDGCVDVRCSLNELCVDGVIEVQFQSIWDSFESAPEKFSSFFDDMVSWEGIEKLFDLMIEHILEDADGQFYANFIAFLRIGLVQFLQGLQFTPEGGGVLPVLFLQLSQKVLSILEETDQFSRCFGEGALEVVPSPLDGVFDLIGEILERAKRDAFLWRVDDVGVADGRPGDDDLGVAFGAEGAAFEERLLEPDALSIDILSGLDVIDRIDNEFQIGPKVIIEDGLILGCDSQFQSLEIDLRVDTFSN